MKPLVNKRGRPCNRCRVCAALTRGIRIVYCDDCLEDSGVMSQAKRVYSENYRAEAYELEATLTCRDWFSTLAYFTVSKRGEPWVVSCAYCGIELPVERIGIDHWIVLAKRRLGTTHGNCLPVCADCNFMKGMLNGLQFFELMIHQWQSPVALRNYDRIQHYFKEMFRLDKLPV